MNRLKCGKFTANNGALIMVFLIKALIMSIDVGLCAAIGESVNGTNVPNTVNLTAITWDHAVNRFKKLNKALESDVKMIEADVYIGKYVDGKDVKENEVIMAHGPDEDFSDLSLSRFLSEVTKHNTEKEKMAKGIKLDFKTIEAFEKSIDMLQTINAENYAVWLNADIVKSSIASTNEPVDAERFIKRAKELKKKYTWSVGWTTKWTEDGITSGKYTDKDVDEMIKALKEQPDQSITFPVRAGLVVNSQAEMKKLLTQYENSTLTVWSSPSDEVNAKELQKFIQDIGVNKVYLDVPKMLSNKLDLGTEDKAAKSTANKITHIGLLSIVMFILTNLF